MADYNRGLAFVLLAAVVSGFSIFFNSLVVKGLNPFVFTTMKNLLVAFFLLSLLFLLKEFSGLKRLSLKNWATLGLIGVVGGSIPFWVYFYAIKIGSEIYSTPYGIVAGFFHKATLFVFVTIFAVLFLKEKISKNFLAGGLLLLLANFLLAKNFFGFGFPEFLLFAAIFFWAVEYVLSKWALRELSGNIVAFGRMFFGSLVLLFLLFFTSQSEEFFAFDFQTVFWAFVTSVPLFFFVFFLYNGLKHVEVSKAVAVLMLGQPVTLLLSIVFSGTIPSVLELLSMALIVAGVILSAGFSVFLSFGKKIFPRYSENK